MDWLLICSAFAFVGVAIWLWRSAQSGLVSLGRIWKGRTVGTAVAYCPVCGQPQRPSWEYCPYCAQREAQQAAAAVAAPPPTPPALPPVLTGPVAPQPPAAPPPRMEKIERLRSARPEELAWLVLLSGTHAGMEFRLGEITTIGRDPSCDIVLDDTTASRQHAQVRLEGQTFTIYDLGSASGTYVNNRNIGRARLIDGDRIQIGQTVLIFKQVDRGLIHERRGDQSTRTEPVSSPPRPFRHQIAVTGKVPTRMYEQDSCALQLRLLPSRLKGLAVQDSKVISFTSDREEPRVEVELQAVGFEVAGNTAQAYVWDGKQSHQCLWNISPRRSGSFEIGLVFRAQTCEVMEQVDALVYPISVRKYASLSKRQVQFLAGTLSAVGTLLGLAEVLRRLGVF